MGHCLKQTVTCVITDESTGVSVEATNRCSVGDATVCPRVTLGCASGEGYENCGPPVHAEVAAIADAKRLGMSLDTARVYGHTYICGPCDLALKTAGVKRMFIHGKEIAR